MSYKFDPTNFDSSGFPFRTADEQEQASIAGLPAFIRLVEFSEKPDEFEMKLGCGPFSIAEEQKYMVMQALSALQTYVDIEIGICVFLMMDMKVLQDVLDVLKFYSLGTNNRYRQSPIDSIENGRARLCDITQRYLHYASVCKASLEL